MDSTVGRVEELRPSKTHPGWVMHVKVVGGLYFTMPMPQAGAPTYLCLGSKLLRFLSAGEESGAMVYVYGEMAIVAVRVPGDVLVTRRDGESRPASSW